MGKWAGVVGVRVRAVNGKAQEIRTHPFHNYSKLFSYYKHSNPYLLDHTSVQSTHLVGPRTEILIRVPVCGRCIAVFGFPQVE